jgi:CheY-like chemotaxis protein
MWFFNKSKLQPKKPPLILLVDDEIQYVAMLRSNLEHEGYRIEFATDGLTGKQMAWDLKPDLIISDVFMPGVDGVTMMESINERQDMGKIPIILLSGQAIENFVPSPKDPTMKYALLKKPVFLPELNTLIKKFLS